MQPPAADAASPSEPSEALVEQLSFYFTDANLRRDRFMKSYTGADGTGAKCPHDSGPARLLCLLRAPAHWAPSRHCLRCSS